MKKLLVISLLLFTCFSSIGQTDEEKEQEILEQAVFRVQKDIERAERLKVEALKDKELYTAKVRADAQLDVLKILADVDVPRIYVSESSVDIETVIKEQEKKHKKDTIINFILLTIVLTVTLTLSITMSVYFVTKKLLK